MRRLSEAIFPKVPGAVRGGAGMLALSLGLQTEALNHPLILPHLGNKRKRAWSWAFGIYFSLWDKSNHSTGRNTREGLGRLQVVCKRKSHCLRMWGSAKGMEVLCAFVSVCACVLGGGGHPRVGGGWAWWVGPEQRATQPFLISSPMQNWSFLERSATETIGP